MQKGIIRNKRYRNRRIGDFLKELDMTEGRGTGIPIIRKEMAKNGSPEPRFETDDNYSYFITTLPIHPAFLEADETLNETINRPINGPINKDVKDAEKQYIKILSFVNEELNGPINSPLNGPINELAKLFEIIYSKEGINRIEIIAKTEKGRTTITRYLTVLKDCGLIDYVGSRKTGGYYLTEKAQNKLKE